MKKKLMMVATLVGILSLGACVDNKESDSVVGVRNAKTEQLKAMAALDNAKAQAELIYANAEKAVKEAEAEYLRAQAAAANADAAHQKEMTDQAKQKFVIDLEVIRAEAANALLYASIEAARYERDLLRDIDDRIAELYSNYSIATSSLAGLNQQLLTQNLALAGLEAGVVSQEAYIKQQTINYTRTIERNTARKAALEALNGNNKVELAKQLEELTVQRTAASTEWTVANDVSNKANTAYSNEVENFSYYYGSPKVKTVYAAYRLIANNWGGVWGIVNFADYELTENLSVDYYTLVQSRVLMARNNLTDYVRSQNDYIGKAKVGTTAATGLYLNLENAQKAKTDADGALAAAVTANEPESVLEYLRSEVRNAEINVARANENIASANVTLADLQKNLSDFEALVASFSGADKTAYDAALVALKELAVAKEAAEKASDVAYDKYDNLRTLYSSVQSIYLGTTDIPSEIAACEYAIANAQANIARLTDTLSAKSLLADAKEEIEILKAKIAAQQIIVTKAKAALDAALAK